MKKTGIAQLPLHSGKAPSWLFNRMVKLSREIIYLLCLEFGRMEVLKRLADPFWFQALGCVLGFDWHSSGVTTTVCGAIKEALKDIGKEVGIFAVGGKGRVALNVPQELERYGDILGLDIGPLVYASKMAAKVDNVALQDGYQLYHHCLFFTKDGSWSVVQQGMNAEKQYARRYHWLSQGLTSFVCEPHKAICTVKQATTVLNLVAKEGEFHRQSCIRFIQESSSNLLLEAQKVISLKMPRRHYLLYSDLNITRLKNTLLKVKMVNPKDFESLLSIRGVGAKTLRALSLIAEVIYGSRPSFRDPARFSFAHGGKDGHPYPVNRQIYDQSIEVLKEIINASKIGVSEKRRAFKRLASFASGL